MGFPNYKHQSQLEVETTLVVCSDKAKDILDKIANLNQISDYQFLARYLERIHDIYFDTKNKVLETHGLRLRLRKIGSITLLTLKGRPRKHHNLAVKERFEIEKRWSHDTKDWLVKELRSRNIPVQKPKGSLFNPVSFITSMGFCIMQTRSNDRIIRKVVMADQRNGPVLAELAMDRVIYHFTNQKICHYEVEIEAKIHDNYKVLNTIAKVLVNMYPRELMVWNIGKSTMGYVIEVLIEKGKLGKVQDYKQLCWSDYEKIKEHLSNTHIT